MSLDKNIPRFLGIAYLIQFVASFFNDALFNAATGSGDTLEKIVNISNNVILMRLSVFSILITGLGIIAMTVLLYIVLQNQSKPLALLALSFWIIEVIFLIASCVGINVLIPLSLESVGSGFSDLTLVTMASLLIEFKEFTYAIHLLFFGCGGILWYYLFYKSKYIPRALALWALIMMPFMIADVVLVLFGIGLDSIMRMVILFPLIAYLPFEGIMGIWFIVKGIDDDNQYDEMENEK